MVRLAEPSRDHRPGRKCGSRALGCRIATAADERSAHPHECDGHLGRHQPRVAGGRNRYAAVTHDDCRVRHDWLERLAARLAEIGDSALLTGRVEPEGEGIVLTVQTWRIGRPSIRRRSCMAMYSSPPIWAFALLLGRPDRPLGRAPVTGNRGRGQRMGASRPTGGCPHRLRPDHHCGPLGSTPAARICRRSIGATHVVTAPFTARGFGAVMASLPVAQVRDLVRAPWLLARGLITRNSDLIAMGRGEIERAPAGNS